MSETAPGRPNQARSPKPNRWLVVATTVLTLAAGAVAGERIGQNIGDNIERANNRHDLVLAEGYRRCLDFEDVTISATPRPLRLRLSAIPIATQKDCQLNRLVESRDNNLQTSHYAKNILDAQILSDDTDPLVQLPSSDSLEKAILARTTSSLDFDPVQGYLLGALGGVFGFIGGCVAAAGLEGWLQKRGLAGNRQIPPTTE